MAEKRKASFWLVAWMTFKPVWGVAWRAVLSMLWANVVFKSARYFGVDDIVATIGTIATFGLISLEYVLKVHAAQNKAVLDAMEDWRGEMRRKQWDGS